ncbi:MAG: hypothetical protein ABIE43_03320 [Patescibacteria group bacterium]
MRLEEVLNNKELKTIEPSKESAELKFKRGLKKFKFAQNNLTPPGFEEEVYSAAYDAVRIVCEAFLLLKGYKARSGDGYHWRVIEAVKCLLKNDIKEEIYFRISRMRNKRHGVEYDTTIISDTEMRQAIKDTVALISVVGKKIKGNTDELFNNL